MRTLIIADDSELIRTELKRILKGEPEIQLLGEAVSFQDAIDKVADLRPDVLLLDLHMPDDRVLTLDYIQSQLQAHPVKIVAMSLSGEDDKETREIAETLGACKILEKSRINRDLIPTVLNC
jgi:two-component system, chemotaxis family, protein-glutamate methylesterase/glutaminase